jgi:hypothetical protein
MCLFILGIPITSFSNSMENIKTANGESYLRTWLVYSESSNKTFCICCKLFSSKQMKSSLTSDGNCNWKHLHEYLRGHENSPQHLRNHFQWFDMCRRLDAGNTIDQELQHTIVKGTRLLESHIIYVALSCTCPKTI